LLQYLGDFYLPADHLAPGGSCQAGILPFCYPVDLSSDERWRDQVGE
jgi:hypothetical protein